MFFILSKILEPCIHPLTHICLLLIIALMFHRKLWLSKTCIILALLLLWIFGTYPVPDLLLRTLENRCPRISPLPHADAVVVLCGMVHLQRSTPENIEFSDGVDRIIGGMRLVKDGYAPWLIISGGSGDLFHQDKSEARLLRQFAIDFGIPDEQILLDPGSRNTYENAVNTKALMEEYRLSQIILVTTAAHLPRSMGCFKKLGVNPIPYGVDYHAATEESFRPDDIIPDTGILRQSSATLHEYIGLAMYKLAGYI